MDIGGTKIQGWDNPKWTAALAAKGYPKAADPKKINWFMAELILLIMVIYVTMVYGPIAAFLVEMFPTKIRYTSMSLPYHIGNGWFGGMLPLLATAVVAATRRYLCWPLVPDHRCCDDVGDRGSFSFAIPRALISPPVPVLRSKKADCERAAGNRRPALSNAPHRGAFSFPATDELEHHFPAVRIATMFDEVDGLPGAEREFSASQRHMQ